MNFLSILKSLEEVAYEIALWVILIPKTVFKVVFHPGNVSEYVKTELEKDEKKQFADNMSPIIFWMLLVVVPAYTCVKYFIRDIPAYLTNKPENYFFYIMATLISFLVTPALLLHILEKKKFDKESFKASFYTQCYIQAPVSLVMIFCLAWMKYIHYDFRASDNPDYTYFLNAANGWKDIFIIPILGVFSFLSFMEVKLIMKTGRSVMGAIGYLFLCFFVFLFAMFITAGIGFVLFIGL